MNKLLIEILSEEIPAVYQLAFHKQTKELLENAFRTKGFEYDNLEVDGTPRRIYAFVDIEEYSKEVIEEKRGPLETAPQKALDGFLRSNSCTIDQCEKRELKGKVYWFYKNISARKHLTDELPEIVNCIIKEIKWPKVMKWGTSKLQWARPIRNAICIYDDQPVQFSIKNTEVQTSCTTKSHRAKNVDVHIESACVYKQRMQENDIILSRDERKDIILRGFKLLQEKENVAVDVKQSLLEEVIGLVEYPVVLCGTIEKRFMELPEEVLTTTMRVHQRYFPTYDSNGRITNKFAFIANIDAVDGGATIIKGNQRVLSARLYDAMFFFDVDKKRHLEAYKEELKKIEFYDGLGTIYDRVQRIQRLAEKLSKYAKRPTVLIRAAELCKCDLKTHMVSEFTELQGVMGGYYAKHSGESDDVCNAIKEHYLPLGGDQMPKTLEGSLLSIADKIDLLTCFFAVGRAPTGSKDPFALRRAAIGIIKLVIAKEIDLNDLHTILSDHYAFLKSQFSTAALQEDTVKKVEEFIQTRMVAVLEELGVSKVVSRVFINSLDLLGVYKKAKYLSETQYRDSILAAYKRLQNFEKSDATSLREELLSEKEEISLYKRLKQEGINLYALHELTPFVNDFLDNVTIETKDSEQKKNRYALISMALSEYKKEGDFSYAF